MAAARPGPEVGDLAVGDPEVPDRRSRFVADTGSAQIGIRQVGPEAAAAVHAVVRSAFGARPRLDPPADADRETPQSIAAALTPCGGLVAERDGVPIGALILDRVGSRMFLRRFGVVPAARGTGVASGLVAAAVEVARDCDALAIVAREELPETVIFWQSWGFRATGGDPPQVWMERPLRIAVDVVDADSMRRLGRQVGALLGAGDVLVLNGELGAGKTTFTQGVGAGLGVRGDITSPTFVIARVHPGLAEGPDLVHVDAYRLAGVAELEDLDLDLSLDEAVTVVEWGGDIAEGLAESRLEITIERAAGEPKADPAVDLAGDLDSVDPRRVLIRPVGPRWRRTDWSTVLR
ncbi:MAG: tRNA (adenosine(37)-N6)-threonylcarbamoyltransferase complex ATPase subunit type 1 TsaE [Nocardioides sp.]